VIARFGLFLRVMGIEHGNVRLAPLGSPWFGATLTFSGALALIWSTWSYVRLIRALKRGETEFSHGSTLAVTVAVLLAIVGLALTAHLLLVNGAAAQPTQ